MVELVGLCKIAGRSEAYFDVSVLPVSAGLFFVFVFDVGILFYRFAERDLRFFNPQIDFIFVFQNVLNDVEMQISHTVHEHLSVDRIVDRFKRRILRGNFCHRLRDFIDIGFIDRVIAETGIRNGEILFGILNRRRLRRKRVARLYAAEFCNGAQIAGMEFGDFRSLIALHDVQLSDFEFG